MNARRLDLSRPPRRGARGAIVALVALLALAACGGPAPSGPSGSASPQSASGVPEIPDWRDDPNEPFPFTSPVPPLAETPVDGVYVRDPTDPYEGDRAHCTRCPPYPLDRGVSRLTLVAGRFEVLHEQPQYRSAGHYRVSGDELVLINDPECTQLEGTYRWSLEDGTLTLEAVDDECAFGQRMKDLTALPWSRLEGVPAGVGCEPPGVEAAVSGHWAAPSGC